MTGSGTEGDPYVISNRIDLQNVADDLSAYYELGGNIDASMTAYINEGLGFDPIGDATPFTGHFDGKGFAVRDLYINRPDESLVGLFGYTCGATILNVGVVNCTITGDVYTGALVGYLSYDSVAYDSTLSGCWSSGRVTASNDSRAGGLIGQAHNTLISYSCSSCSVSSIRMAGGFVGVSYGDEISECYAIGSVTAPPEEGGQMGGFIGFCNCKSIENCYARGAVTSYYSNPGSPSYEATGGFCGILSDGIIDNCYSTGLVTAPDGAQQGGFCGQLDYEAITDCFWDTDTSGQATSDGGTGLSTAQMLTTSFYTSAGWNFTTIWTKTLGENNGYPILLGGITPGFIWTEGDKLRFISQVSEQQILGSDTGSNAIAGHLFVEGNFLHFVSQNGDERRQGGKLIGDTGVAGHIWIDGMKIFFVDSSGNVRRTGTWILGIAKLGVDTILHSG